MMIAGAYDIAQGDKSFSISSTQSAVACKRLLDFQSLHQCLARFTAKNQWKKPRYLHTAKFTHIKPRLCQVAIFKNPKTVTIDYLYHIAPSFRTAGSRRVKTFKNCNRFLKSLCRVRATLLKGTKLCVMLKLSQLQIKVINKTSSFTC